jgi:hypothetical protein
MFKADIAVVPHNSSAVDELLWNSDSQTLSVRYNDSGTYTYQDIDFSEFLTLATYAHQRGSWGSGLHKWKTEREDEFERLARQEFKTTFKNLHHKDRTRWLKWMREELINS